MPNRQPEDPRTEEQHLRRAVAQVQEEVRQFSEDLDETLFSAHRALFDAYALILNSPEIVEATVMRIHQGNWAPGALRQTIEEYAHRFDAMEDPYLRERGADIRGLGNRILIRLQGVSVTTGDYPSNTILIGRQLSAIDLGLVPLDRLHGIISAEGSSLSHSAILARAHGMPAVMGVRAIPLEPLDNQEVIADGTQGRIYLRPNPPLRKEIKRLICKEQDLEENLKTLRDLPSKTKNGVEVPLYTNVGLGNLRLLLPLVNGIADVEQAFTLIDRAHRQLLEVGVDSSLPPVGLMIEVPSAVYQLEELARIADFFSVGSNDLAQYLLAIDRGNPHVAERLLRRPTASIADDITLEPGAVRTTRPFQTVSIS